MAIILTNASIALEQTVFRGFEYMFIVDGERLKDTAALQRIDIVIERFQRLLKLSRPEVASQQINRLLSFRKQLGQGFFLLGTQRLDELDGNDFPKKWAY